MRFVKLTQFKISHLMILAVMVATMFLMPANTLVSQASEPVTVYVKHYGGFRSWTGGFHQIDPDLKWELTTAILSAGGLPTDENIDRLLHNR
jgi:hypothetical protein